YLSTACRIKAASASASASVSNLNQALPPGASHTYRINQHYTRQFGTNYGIDCTSMRVIRALLSAGHVYGDVAVGVAIPLPLLARALGLGRRLAIVLFVSRARIVIGAWRRTAVFAWWRSVIVAAFAAVIAAIGARLAQGGA